MLNFYSEGFNHNKQPKFENVPLEYFGIKNRVTPELDAIVEKITNNIPARAGIKELLTGEVVFRSFKRAITILLTAKNENQLERAEAALLVTASEIKNYENNGSTTITHNKVALFLYTLQTLIVNLDKWKFPNKEENTYRPNLIKKLKGVKFKCACLGINEDVIRKECFSTDYQIVYDDTLRNFEYLDEEELDAFAKRISKYEVTRYYGDLYKKTLLNHSVSDEYDIEIILFDIKSALGVNHLSLKDYKKNYLTIKKIIVNYIGNDDIYPVSQVTEALKDFIIKEEKFNAIMHRYDTGRTL